MFLLMRDHDHDSQVAPVGMLNKVSRIWELLERVTLVGSLRKSFPKYFGRVSYFRHPMKIAPSQDRKAFLKNMDDT